MRRLILGTAGHIDHGKTALVKALTGVDTDRLKEEKERGITVDLGFAEFAPEAELRFGVVDVPGHEGFIRNMLAGATGMDLVLLVVAADEGVMPQTREHLAIIRLLGVPRIVVALTKSDLVEEEWLELVREEVAELLGDTPYAGSPVHAVSAITGDGLGVLSGALVKTAMERGGRAWDDVARLPMDRVFTIRGTGTVATGTLWSGTLKVGDRLAILPGDKEARVRGLQMHGEATDRAEGGARVAVSLTGPGVSHQDLSRGQTLVGGEGWVASWMLTSRLTILSDTGWELEQNQRVRVHLGTAEVLARAALLEGDRIPAGGEGWVQLRLEEPILARVRDHLVIRSYSPVTTLGGGQVAEVTPRKRRSLRSGEASRLDARCGDSVPEALKALLETKTWSGVELKTLTQETGFPPGVVEETVDHLLATGGAFRVEEHLFAEAIWGEAKGGVVEALKRFHEAEPLRPGMPLEELRQVPLGPLGQKLGEAALQALEEEGTLRRVKGRGALSDFRITFSKAEEDLRLRLRQRIAGAGLAAPTRKELAEEMGDPVSVDSVLGVMEEDGEILVLEGDTVFWRPHLRAAGGALVAELGGSRDLGPADFREVLDLTRKHLLPLLRHFDTAGITTRVGEGRSVARAVPPEWGTVEQDEL